MDAVGKAGGIIEAAICYTGLKEKYSLEYYIEYARKLIGYGAHVLCIKDMTGLLKPFDAKLLIGTLKKEFPNIPINLHTHDNAGAGVATHLAAVEAGVNVINVATDTMSGVTSQPSLGTISHCLKGHARDPKYLINDEDYGLDHYWGGNTSSFPPSPPFLLTSSPPLLPPPPSLPFSYSPAPTLFYFSNFNTIFR